MSWRIVRRWCGAAALLVAMATSIGFAQQSPPSASSTIDSFADAQTIVVARLDPAKVEPKNLLEFGAPALAQANVSAEQQEQLGESLAKYRAAWKAAGGAEIFLFVSLADVPLSSPFLVVQLSDGANAEQLAQLVPNAMFPDHERIAGHLVFGHRETLQRVQKLIKQDHTELKGAFRAVDGAPLQVVAQLPPDVRKVIREFGAQPIPDFGIERVDELGLAFRWIALGVEVAPQFAVRGTLQADSAAGLERLQTGIQRAVRAALARPDARAMEPAVNQVASQLKLRAEDSRLRFEFGGEQANTMLRDALVGPALQARRAAQRNVSVNNLKHIALAFHNYHDTHRMFPPAASLSNDGKPLLSWRVHLLPYLEQGELYRQFKLDEAWDSPHNRELIARMPAVFAAPGFDELARQGKTVYMVPVGEKSVFSNPRGTKIASITDGTSNTILALQVPAERAVAWTQPADWEFNAARPTEGLFPPGTTDINVSLCDGAVRTVSAKVAPEIWRALLQMNDGQVIGDY